MREAIVFEASRSAYAIEQLFAYGGAPMTVGELKSILGEYDDDSYFVLSHDNGYTFGGISDPEIYRERVDEDGDTVWEMEW